MPPKKDKSKSNTSNNKPSSTLDDDGLFITINSTKVLKGLMVAIKHFATEASRKEVIKCGKKHEMRLPYKKRFWLWEGVKY